jgi:DNA repair exonuclease SbcCD ATPase subunit
MEIPAELLEGFDRLHQQEQAEESSQDEQYASTLEKANRKIEAFNRNWNEIEEAATSFFGAIKADREAGGRPDLASAVLFIKDQERRFRIAFSPRLQVEKQMQRAFYALPHSTRARAVATNRKQIATYTRLLEGIRDLSLRLTELQAPAEPSGECDPETNARSPEGAESM